MSGQTTCGLFGCNRKLNPGGARVGYIVDNHTFEVIICSDDLKKVAMGGYRIEHTKTDVPVLRPTPANPFVIS